MKKLFSLILVLCMTLALVACASVEAVQDPATQPSQLLDTGESDFKSLSDRELIAKFIESGKLETPSVSAVAHTDEYWMLWLVQNCDPFWELLSRESGLDSLKTMGLEVAEEYEDSMFCSFSAGRMKNWLLPMLFPELFMEISE